MTLESVAALIILVLTYVGVAVGRIPGLRLDRAGIAFLGGAAMIAVGPLSLEEAFRAIDFDTIALLLGMMIVVAHLKVSGAFRALGALAIEYAHAQFLLLVIVTLMSGVLSAFLVNDAICLVMALDAAGGAFARLQPLPYLVAVAAAPTRADHRKPAEYGGIDAFLNSIRRRRRARASRGLQPSSSSVRPVVTGIRVQGELELHLFRGHMHGGQSRRASTVASRSPSSPAFPPPRRRLWVGRSYCSRARSSHTASTANSTGRC
jgi:hypothetical protein